MALIEYDIQIQNGQATVTCSILSIDKGDRIQFKSNVADAAIVYRGTPPFNGTKGPKLGVPFKVGKNATKPALTVAKALSAKQKVHFDCGLFPAESTGSNSTGSASNSTASKGKVKVQAKAKPAFVPWGDGDDTPPGPHGN